MRKIPVFDILLIIISACIFTVIVELGYSKLISQFCMIFVIIAYYIGKYSRKIEKM